MKNDKKKEYDYYEAGERKPLIEASLVKHIILNGLFHIPRQFLIDDRGLLFGLRYEGTFTAFYDSDTLIVIYK